MTTSIRSSDFLEWFFKPAHGCSYCASDRFGMDKNGRVKCFDDVVVGDRDLLEKKIAAIRMAGPEKLQVVLCSSIFYDISFPVSL